VNIIDKFFEIEKKLYKGAAYRFKKDLWSAKAVAFYMKPFSPKYMTDLTTTNHPHTDFGSTAATDSWRMTKIEFHENVHKWDADGRVLAFSLQYGYPQVLAVPFIIAAVASAGKLGWLALLVALVGLHVGLITGHRNLDKDGVMTKKGLTLFGTVTGISALALFAGTVVGGGWWSALWLGAVAFISPIPFKAKWRRDYEIRGYVASMYQEWLRHGDLRQDIIDYYILQFTGPTYFFMEPNRILIRDEMNYQVDRFKNHEADFLKAWQWGFRDEAPSLLAAEPYRIIKRFFEVEGLANGDD